MEWEDGVCGQIWKPKKTFKYPISRGGKTIFQISMPFCALSFKRFVLFLNWSLYPRQASSTRMIGMLEECKFKNHKFVWENS